MVAGRSPAIGFIFLFVAGLKANCCKFMTTDGEMLTINEIFERGLDLTIAK